MFILFFFYLNIFSLSPSISLNSLEEFFLILPPQRKIAIVQASVFVDDDREDTVLEEVSLVEESESDVEEETFFLHRHAEEWSRCRPFLVNLEETLSTPIQWFEEALENPGCRYEFLNDFAVFNLVSMSKFISSLQKCMFLPSKKTIRGLLQFIRFHTLPVRFKCLYGSDLLELRKKSFCLRKNFKKKNYFMKGHINYDFQEVFRSFKFSVRVLERHLKRLFFNQSFSVAFKNSFSYYILVDHPKNKIKGLFEMSKSPLEPLFSMEMKFYLSSDITCFLPKNLIFSPFCRPLSQSLWEVPDFFACFNRLLMDSAVQSTLIRDKIPTARNSHKPSDFVHFDDLVDLHNRSNLYGCDSLRLLLLNSYLSVFSTVLGQPYNWFKYVEKLLPFRFNLTQDDIIYVVHVLQSKLEDYLLDLGHSVESCCDILWAVSVYDFYVNMIVAVGVDFDKEAYLSFRENLRVSTSNFKSEWAQFIRFYRSHWTIQSSDSVNVFFNNNPLSFDSVLSVLLAREFFVFLSTYTLTSSLEKTLEDMSQESNVLLALTSNFEEVLEDMSQSLLLIGRPFRFIPFHWSSDKTQYLNYRSILPFRFILKWDYPSVDRGVLINQSYWANPFYSYLDHQEMVESFDSDVSQVSRFDFSNFSFEEAICSLQKSTLCALHQLPVNLHQGVFGFFKVVGLYEYVVDLLFIAQGDFNLESYEKRQKTLESLLCQFSPDLEFYIFESLPLILLTYLFYEDCAIETSPFSNVSFSQFKSIIQILIPGDFQFKVPQPRSVRYIEFVENEFNLLTGDLKWSICWTSPSELSHHSLNKWKSFYEFIDRPTFPPSHFQQLIIAQST